MTGLSAWDVAILVAAAYVSIVTLVRLMRRRRDEVIAGLQTEIAAQQRRKRALARAQRARAAHARNARTSR